MYRYKLKLNKNLSLSETFLVQRLKEPLYMEMEKKKQAFNRKQSKHLLVSFHTNCFQIVFPEIYI
jgi:hypothetical protein